MKKPAIRNVRKRFDVCGSDRQEIAGRIEVLRDALHIQDGEIVAIRWQRDLSGPYQVARVVYEVPASMKAPRDELLSLRRLCR